MHLADAKGSGSKCKTSLVRTDKCGIRNSNKPHDNHIHPSVPRLDYALGTVAMLLLLVSGQDCCEDRDKRLLRFAVPELYGARWHVLQKYCSLHNGPHYQLDHADLI